MQKKVRRQKRSENTKQLPKPNPALKALEGLVGDWDLELSNASFLPNPSDTVKGHVTFEWLENGGFLVMRQGDKPPSPPAASWVIGRDEAAENYSILYFDSRGVSRRYEMSFTQGVWKIWREAPGFWQRYEGQVSGNGKTITAHWENSPDGKQWKHDFDLTYTRVSS